MLTALRAAVLLSGFVTGTSQVAGAAPARAASPGEAPTRAAPAPRRARPNTPPERLVLRGGASGTGSETAAEYGGVTPGLPQMPRIILPRAAATHCYVTWTGFQLLPNGSRVFLQLNRAPNQEVRSLAGEIQVALPVCRVHHWNNLRPLDLRFFDTPLSGARVRWNRRQGATLHLSLKRPAQPQMGVVKLQGWTYLFVTFRHARSAPAAPSRRPPPPRAAARGAPRGPSPP